MKISFNKHFYELEAIKKAIKDFKNACKCKIVKNMPLCIEVEIEGKGSDKDYVGNEFCNYVLGLMKNEEGLHSK